ncbi:hypothetical protein Aau02nite_57060 [Amorphoplanes auranticolor]|uniref:Uncharacterized protein n=1 Tax=Actinoplanes auranticolor TaxID=47988 RepID=A0A919SMI3_9ACTN|nr:hypothetical protein Aau02nite_57060 [Actinoplanes auranticolor]
MHLTGLDHHVEAVQRPAHSLAAAIGLAQALYLEDGIHAVTLCRLRHPSAAKRTVTPPGGTAGEVTAGSRADQARPLPAVTEATWVPDKGPPRWRPPPASVPDTEPPV